MKQVLIIADSDPRKKIIGGVGVYSYNLSKYLIKKGFRIIFIGKKQKGKIINKFKNMKFIELNKKSNQSNYIFLRKLFKVANKIKLSNNTIIHSQRPDWLVPFSRFNNKKIVTLHGSHSKNVYLKKGFLIGKIYSRLEKKGLELADVIISVSEDNKEYYKNIYRNSPEVFKKIITIPVGIDLNRFNNLDKNKSRKKYGFKKSDKIVLYIGRFEKEKNLKFLIEVCNKTKVKLFLVGDGREENNLKKFVGQIKSDTIFHKSVNSDIIPEILACGDVFALTSLYEGFPTIVIEALAAGLPIISTNVGDVKKLVIDGKTGYLVNKYNVVKKLKHLIQNPTKYKENCIKKSKEYSLDKIGEIIVKQYN